MPICDFKAKAAQAYKSCMNDESISTANKNSLASFSKIYREPKYRPATQAKFYAHIRFFLRKTKDAKKDMHDPEVINQIFADLSENLSPGYYASVINCTNRYVRWLNDGIKPRGFKDITAPDKRSQRRNLVKDDMWEWEDGKNAASLTTSVQLKAILLTQLNGGLRPSEFVDLNYGDVEVSKPFIILHIRDGKTGPREVILYYAVPYLLKWLNLHPTKRKDDPLWVMENSEKSHRKGDCSNDRQPFSIRRYQYPALKKRIRVLAGKAGIQKPTDLYTLRHSCARLLKLWGVQAEEAAKNMGHSLFEFTETYGRLDTNDRQERHGRAYGVSLEQKTKTMKETLGCKRCDYVNEPGTEHCQQCGAALNLKKALEEEQEKEKQLEQMTELVVEAKLNEIMKKHGLSRT